MNEHDDTNDAATPGPDTDPTASTTPTALDDGPMGPDPSALPGPDVSTQGAGSDPIPPPAAAVAREGLVRDPYASFAGVLSGVAHRYGWSVVAVRLAFIALLIASFGSALLLYLAAWIIVPRARFWPPTVVRDPGERLSNRDLGLAIAGVGLVAFLLIGADGAASVLVPLVLVGAGVWLLLQHQRSPLPEPVGTDTAHDDTVPVFATRPPLGQPVPPRRRRRWILATVAVVLVVTVVLMILGALLAFTQSEDGFSISVGNDAFVAGDYRPQSLDDLPNGIGAGVGAVRIDLTDIPLSEFEALDEPFELDIELGTGRVDLTLPAGLAVSIDAATDDGRVDVDGATLDGAAIGPSSLVLVDPESVLDVFVAVDEGDVVVTTTP